MDEFPMEYAVFVKVVTRKYQNEDHIVSFQNQDFMGVETDFHTFYKYVVRN